MRILFIAAAIVAIACADASAQAYRWVDKDGRVHYTQTPPPPDAKDAQKKTLRGSVVESSSLPYAAQTAAKDFPVTLYTSADCGAPCDQARALLVKRAVPFREISVVDQQGIDEVEKIAGKNRVPLLTVGSQVQSGFLDDAYNSLLDSAGYPSSGMQLPLDALRKMDAPGAAPAR
ncbi:MAG: glutaredoxin family protein [Burkholderiales bacterium]